MYYDCNIVAQRCHTQSDYLARKRKRTDAILAKEHIKCSLSLVNSNHT